MTIGSFFSIKLYIEMKFFVNLRATMSFLTLWATMIGTLSFRLPLNLSQTYAGLFLNSLKCYLIIR